MPDPANIANSGVSPQVKEVIEGTIYKTPLPGEQVLVVIPGFSDEHTTSCAWSPQVSDEGDGIYYPHEGDVCYVGREGEYEKVVLYWVTSGDPDKTIAGDSSILEDEGLGVVIVTDDEEDEPVRPPGFAHRWFFAAKVPKTALLNDIWTKTE